MEGNYKEAVQLMFTTRLMWVMEVEYAIGRKSDKDKTFESL